MFQKKPKKIEFSEEKTGAVGVAPDGGHLAFSSTFQNIGGENLSLPRIYDSMHGSYGWVYFGAQNNFPQLVNQMYYTSPINGAIINFKTNATIGGGFSITPNTDDLKEKAKAFLFENIHKVSKTIEPLTKDLYLHNSCYVLMKFSKDGVLIGSKRVPREQVRNTKDRKLYFICEDWLTMQGGVRPIRKYTGQRNEPEMLLCFEGESVGQTTYSIASYTSCLNWCQLDGEMSYLHKSNIQNSIFPSFAIMFPRKPKGDVERQAITNSIQAAKGSSNAGKVFALFANNKEEIPTVAPIPTNQNDKLFEQTDERIDAQVCKAHCIDPILMGIRTSGKLGNGAEIKQSYVIFEKNTIMPMRGWVEQIYNELIKIAGVKAKFVVNNYQIINETITEVDETNKIVDSLGKLDALVANKVLDQMSPVQILSLIGVKPDEEFFKKKAETQKTEI